MKAGDIIKCSSLDDAVERVDALIRDGYGVELNHGKGEEGWLKGFEA